MCCEAQRAQPSPDDVQCARQQVTQMQPEYNEALYVAHAPNSCGWWLRIKGSERVLNVIGSQTMGLPSCAYWADASALAYG